MANPFTDWQSIGQPFAFALYAVGKYAEPRGSAIRGSAIRDSQIRDRLATNLRLHLWHRRGLPTFVRLQQGFGPGGTMV